MSPIPTVIFCAFSGKRNVRKNKMGTAVMTVPEIVLRLLSLRPGRVFLVHVDVQLAESFLGFLHVELAVACQA